MIVITRERKSKFVKKFDKTSEGILCPHFYELILSNGCPYDCQYCYLKLTFRGNVNPQLFENHWEQIEEELEKSPSGIYNTGELADSLAVIPPNLEKAIKYFSVKKEKFLLLVTKSNNIKIFRDIKPNKQIIISFSINCEKAWEKYELKTPSPDERISAIKELITLGWRVRVRLDPIILEWGILEYKSICDRISKLNVERITIGSLRQFATLSAFAKNAPREGLELSVDRRLRYRITDRVNLYREVASWLGYQPALCKETKDIWSILGWKFNGCNCTY